SHSNSNSNSISNSNSPSSNATSIHESSPDPDDASSYQSSINFVYANDKRFTDFHSLFRSVPEEEKLIEDYGCALQKEILVQGRLYISENHICFNANIFGWVTNLVIAFSEVTAIEKRMTAFVIPNAISIVTTTNTKGHFFASFLSRDAAHDLLIAGWRKSFP
ncbi:MAG: GRAM domain-containing protein, partial [Podila humilis]